MTGLVEFFRERLGMQLWPGQVEVLSEWAESGKPNALLCLGRRAGKNTMMAGFAIFNAIQDYSRYPLPAGWPRYIIVVANSKDQAIEFITQVRVLLSNATDPDLLALVDPEACTRSKVVFRHSVAIEALPCSERSTRGRAVSLVIFDEAAQFKTDEEGFGAGREIYRALEPAVAQFGLDGHLVFTSTPKWRFGLFHDQYKDGISGKDQTLFVAQRPTWEMNPTMPREHPVIAKAYLLDPDGAATEYGADFSAAEGAFIDPRDVDACRRESGNLSPNPLHAYKAAIDPAFQRDAFAMAIAHKEPSGVIVDGAWTWTRRGFEQTLNEVVEVARRYGIRQLRTDQYSSPPVIEGLAKRGMSCDAIPWDNANKFAAFTRMKGALIGRQLSLPNDDALADEIQNLEATATVTGLVRIAASSGHHDDRATVVAALMDMLEGSQSVIVMSQQDYLDYTPALADSANPFDLWPMVPDFL